MRRQMRPIGTGVAAGWDATNWDLGARREEARQQAAARDAGPKQRNQDACPAQQAHLVGKGEHLQSLVAKAEVRRHAGNGLAYRLDDCRLVGDAPRERYLRQRIHTEPLKCRILVDKASSVGCFRRRPVVAGEISHDTAKPLAEAAHRGRFIVG